MAGGGGGAGQVVFSGLLGEVFRQPEGFLGPGKLGTLVLRGGKMGLFLRVVILRGLPGGDD